MSDSNETSDSAEFRKSLEDIAFNFRSNVDIKDRKYRLKTYKQCFVGSEGVDYLLETGHAQTREDAVMLGRSLAHEFHLFEHVTRDHEFADDYKFYRFVDASERGTLTMDEKIGKYVRWSDFLAPVASGEALQPAFAAKSENLELIESKDQHVIGQVWPLDKYNTQLLDNVHPPSWQDPKAHNEKDGTYSYDMVVVGGGTGGLITAAGSAGVGARVAMIEEHMLGGDCLNVGCVPSKALIHSANLAHTLRGDMEHLADAGISLDPSAVKVDFEKAMERVRRIRAGISHHDSAERYSKELGVQIFLGRGKFTSERTVEVNGKTLTFKRAVIATGGYPNLLPIEGLKSLHDKATAIDSGEPRPIVMTNETIFNLTKRPQNMLVIGAGVIGMELAQAMQRLGSKVKVMGRSGRVLPKEDADLAQVVKDQMIKDGVEFRLDVSEYLRIEMTGEVLDNGYPEMKLAVMEKGNDEVVEFKFDALLLAAGRRPNVTGMDLEAAKVDYDVKKGLLVSDKLQTTNPRIFGVGDCCSEFKFTHAADFMARAVIRNALFLGKEKMSNLLIPYATFTSPEIASVGLYESDLKKKGMEFRVFEKHFKDNDRAICDGKTAGMVRFRVDAKSDRILGASIVGEGAGNMISEVTLAMQSDTGMTALAAVIHPYPTTAEAVRQSGDLYSKTRLTTTVKSLLRGIISLQR
ncbi:Dihydrolipoyl dehydrogenase [Seminavis robusta]|uniref:Dihydrolipoyl dehydrogenase n=1 Tax=Seminavis robusta TaxID=568900 RepID=A0A9N8E624_9STRA|nr:Dihydrolipoyl dehydrogenase [Seminavis robusta]|eukprot:Sro691_g187870.1 Dihydrolipoyl dehydrogenase (692) ;mRNA; f:29463-31751